jgi:hypothetical protein
MIFKSVPLFARLFLMRMGVEFIFHEASLIGVVIGVESLFESLFLPNGFSFIFEGPIHAFWQ